MSPLDNPFGAGAPPPELAGRDELLDAIRIATRADPFGEVWSEVEELLERDAGLQAKAVFEELGRRYPGRFQAGQLRTLQRPRS